MKNTKPYLNINLLNKAIINANLENECFLSKYFEDLLTMNKYNTDHNIKLEKEWNNGDYYFKIYDHNTNVFHLIDKNLVIE